EDRQAADKLRYEAELQEIFGLHVVQQLAAAPAAALLIELTAEAHLLATGALADDVFQAHEGAAAAGEDVGRVDLEELLLRMLSAALGRHARHRAFDDLQERLLHAFARDVARDRGILGLARDLVDLVDVDDAALCLLDVVVGGLEQVEDDVFHVL